MSSQRSAPSTPQRLKSARNIHASLSATPTTNHAALSKREAKDLWEHTALLFRNYDWSEAVVCTQRLLRRSQHTVGLDSAAVWANLGILRMHLGEYYLAFEAFEKAMKVVGVSVAGESDPDDECTSCASAASSPSTSVSLFLPSPSLRPQPWPRARKQSSHAETSNPAVLTPGSLRTDTALIKRVTSALAQHFATPADGSGSGSVPTHRHPHLALQRHPHLTRYQHFPHHKYHQHLPTTAIFPFLAALAAYHLPRDDPDSPGSTADTASLRLAQRLFRTCLLLLPEGVEKVDMASRGLAWTLERTRVVWNERICGVEAGLEEGMGELVAGERWGVNGLPGRLCFEFVERK